MTTVSHSLSNPGEATATENPVRIRRAILSAYDKTGLVELARVLHGHGVEIVSTGGTMKVLRDAGLDVTSVETLTGFGSMLGGRLKTLHPHLLGGILARADSDDDRRQLRESGIDFFQLVVINLYPFARAADDPDASVAEAIELIDVGGPTMIRAAAKNHASVTVVCDPADYEALAEELKHHEGAVSASMRCRLAARAFALTAAYDARIAAYMTSKATDVPAAFPEVWIRPYARVGSLRYGENPHQAAAVYTEMGAPGPSLAGAPVVGGKALSYNNLNDLDAAWRMAADFEEPFAAVFKHANPCGAAMGDTMREAYEAAHATDPLSAYGSIVALNRVVDFACAEALNATTFIECVLAPGYDDDAMELLRRKKARRYVTVPTMDARRLARRRFRELVGGLLVQDADRRELTRDDLRVVTRVTPSDAQMDALLFSRRVVKHAKSNAIVLSQGCAAVGIGAGQTSRVDAVRSAVERAGARAQGAVLASDAFFPMRDGVEVAARAGVAAIIQPGGSKRDAETIAACDEFGVAMVFSGLRNFRH